MFVDSHAHLDDPQFDADRPAVIERARAAGVTHLLAVGGGTGPENLASPIFLAEPYHWIWASVGVHPHEARHFQPRHAEQIRKSARHPKVVAIGEIGLDYHYEHSPREVQRQVFIGQIELARELKLPIIIHCREAWSDLGEIVEEHWQSCGLGGILHCFTGSAEDARKFLGWGFLISFAGNVTFKNAEALRSVAREVPLDRLLTETDCPYLAPIPHRGKRNEPALVRDVTRAIAALRGLHEGELGQAAVENFTRFVSLKQR